MLQAWLILKNVADAINKAISANAYHWQLAAENTSTAPEVINKSDTVIFGGGQQYYSNA